MLVHFSSTAGYPYPDACNLYPDAAFGLGGEDGHLTVSLDKLRNLSLAANGSVTIGGGNRLGDVALYLWNHGEYTISSQPLLCRTYPS